MLAWSKAVWMDDPSPMTIFNQSECIILALNNHAIL